MRISGFERAERGVIPRALAVGTKVRHEHGIAECVEELGSRQHRESVGVDAVQKEDGTFAGTSGNEPAAEPASGSARELDLDRAEGGGSRSDGVG